MLTNISIRKPADMHVHFRQGEMLRLVTPATANAFGVAVAMPNTKPPITTPEQAKEYCSEIVHAAGSDNGGFRVLGIAYLCKELTIKNLRRGFQNSKNGRAWYAVKAYPPPGGTTGSEHAPSSILAMYRTLNVMEELGIPLLIHGELLEYNGKPVARWGRERAFIEHVLPDILERFPQLKIVLEHLSTAEGVAFVEADLSGRLSATITPHHLLFTDSDVGLRPDGTCMPIVQRFEDLVALRRAATSGDPRFFAGTDSAPHAVESKYAAACACGAFVAPGALSAYAQVFEEEGVFKQEDGIERFERFMSLNGPNFYDVLPAEGRNTLVRKSSIVSERFPLDRELGRGATEVVPLFHKDLGLVPDGFSWRPHTENQSVR